MSRHFTHRGIEIDIDGIRRSNEDIVAIGNMGANARGDIIKGNTVVQTAAEIAKKNHRVVTAVTSTSIKGPDQPNDISIEQPSLTKKSKKPVERELDSGDIVLE